jgi:hypothetical protein
MKDNAAFSCLDWSDNQLTFKLSSYLKNSSGLTFLLPVNHGNLKISQIAVNNQKQKFESGIVKGIEYAFVTVTPGNTYNISAKYQ